ncbi:MAG: 3-methyl-2-oxobutanoate hydroxymethyltransferase [Syntrophales bacterium]
MAEENKRPRVTTAIIRDMKSRGEKIAALTAYDYPTAHLLDQSGIDVLLVGDSLGMVVLGYASTLPVTMEEMIHHTKAVCRGVERAMVIADMPFMSYQVSADSAVQNAGRFLKETDAQAVKLEGGREVAELIRRMTVSGIPVMGHLGLTPQSVQQFGGFKVQGRGDQAARRILEDARILAEAGAFSVVLEAVPAALAAEITGTLGIPTIGIGAGAGCDGQILVTNDMLGAFERFTPRFVKKYATLSVPMREAFARYSEEVKSGAFPGKEHSF